MFTRGGQMDNRLLKSFIVIFFIGIVLGTIAVNLLVWIRPFLREYMAIDPYILDENMLQTPGEQIVRICVIRLLQIIGLFLGSFILGHILLFYGIDLCIGLIWGGLLSVEYMRLGIWGLALAIVYLLPYLAGYMCGIINYGVSVYDWIDHGHIEKRRLLWGSLFVLSGILGEAYISPAMIRFAFL